jgi:hypothetical protein
MAGKNMKISDKFKDMGNNELSKKWKEFALDNIAASRASKARQKQNKE